MIAVSASEAASLRGAVLDWYRHGHRDLPWRGTRDPYAVLVSEVMLQQTQANRVAERYPRFMARFPTVAALASAPEAQVLAEWSGLGYNRRALSLHRAAVVIAAEGWPSDLEGLRRLPGVGAYTARAIGSLAFGWPLGAVDTNVRRWLLRRFGMGRWSTGTHGPALQSLADALAAAGDGHSLHDAATWTHASMELGAVVCRAQRPLCKVCPIAVGCSARGRAQRVPVASQRPFRGSRRAYRGALLRALASAPNHALPREELLAATASAAARGALGGAEPQLVHVAVNELEREGLAHLDGDRLRLGPRSGPEAGRGRRLQSAG